jgi:hypothetical protein
MISHFISSIHQVEITSRCNLRCKYCVHPHMVRAKEDMSEDVYLAALVWARKFARRGTQQELNLAGIGESTMHPDFVRWTHLAREAVGPACRIVLATNGLLMTDEMAQAIAPARPMVWVSLHRPEKAGPAVEALKRAGIFAGVSMDPALAAIDWAGQVDWHVSVPERRQCQWVRNGLAFVMSDGRVSSCCLDSDGSGVFASDIRTANMDVMTTQPYRLCETCNQEVE